MPDKHQGIFEYFGKLGIGNKMWYSGPLVYKGGNGYATNSYMLFVNVL